MAPTFENLPVVALLMSTEGICTAVEAQNLLASYEQEFCVAVQKENGVVMFLQNGGFIANLWKKDVRYLKWLEKESVNKVTIVIATAQLIYYPGEQILWKRRLPAFMQDALFALFICLKRAGIVFVTDARIYLRDMMRREWLQMLDGK